MFLLIIIQYHTTYQSLQLFCLSLERYTITLVKHLPNGLVVIYLDKTYTTTAQEPSIYVTYFCLEKLLLYWSEDQYNK